MQRPLPRLDVLAVLLFLSQPVMWPVRHRTQSWDVWQHWQSRGCILQTSPHCREAGHHHKLEVCYQALGKQIGFYQIKCWDCLGRAYKDCQEQRWSLCYRFSSYKLLKISMDSSPTCTRLQRTQCLFTVPSKIKIAQPGRSTASQPGKIFIPSMNFPRSPAVTMLSDIQSKVISSFTSMGRKSEWGFLLPPQETGGNTMSTSLTYSQFKSMLNQRKNILSLLRCRILVVSAFQHSEVAPLMKEVRGFSSNTTHDVHDGLWTIPPAEALRGRATGQGRTF